MREAPTHVNLSALRHAEQVDRNDAQVWRWFAQVVDEGRLVCQFYRGYWQIILDGRMLAYDNSFDCAVRLVRDIDVETGDSRHIAICPAPTTPR